MKPNQQFAKILMFSALFLNACGGGGGGSDDPGNPDQNDTTPPAKISITGLTVSANSITFTWNDPSDSDFDHIEAVCGSINESVIKGKETCTISGLTASTVYTIYAVSIDNADNRSNETILSARTTATGTIVFETISTAEELNDIRNDLDGNYLLTSDIDLSGYASWTPIGSITTKFLGTLNGNGHTISNLTITDSSSNYHGLFAYTGNSAVIHGLTLTNVNIKGYSYAGALTGYNYGSTIIDCNSSGIVTAYGDHTGGLIGCSEFGIIKDCHSDCDVSNVGNNTATDTDYCGGLIGRIYSGTMANCYTTGNVNGTGSQIGGLAGGNNGTINGCYATGDVSGVSHLGGLIGSNWGTVINCYATGDAIPINTNGYCVGGLIGWCRNKVDNCYAIGIAMAKEAVGGLIGNPYELTISNCYYDTNTTGMSDTGKGAPTTTSLMKTKSTYSGWDFTETWDIDSSINGGYPYLRELAKSYK